MSSYKVVAMLRVKDAILTIRDCLDSLSRICDAAVVVDNGSTDGTLEVYKEYPLVKDVAQTEGFHEGRDKRMAHEMAIKQNPTHILWLDSDECFPIWFDRKEMEKLLDKGHVGYKFWLFHFWNNRTQYRVDGKWGSYASVPQLRLWQHQLGTSFSGAKIHNGLITGLKGPAGCIVDCRDIPLKHYGYADKKKSTEKYQLYTTIDKETGRNYDHIVNESGIQVKQWNVKEDRP